MSNSGNAFPFMPFPIPGLAPTTSQPTLSSGIDLLKSMWGNLPGSSQVPGFLVPTIDVEELDKRIRDLRAAESWVEVNLNMLRATIQGLEVQRNTIAALKSMSTMTPKAAVASAPSWTPPPAPAPAASAPVAAEVEEPDAKETTSAVPGLDAGSWLSFMQDQFSKVAQAALATATTAGEATVAGPAGSAKARPRKPRTAKR